MGRKEAAMKLPNIKRFFGGRDNFVTVAEKILGKGNVFPEPVVAKVFGLKVTGYNVDEYTKMALEEMADANSKGAHWQIFFKPDLSLREIQAKREKDFSPSTIWHRNYSFLLDKSRSGFRALNWTIAPKQYTGVIERIGVSPAKLGTVATGLIVSSVVANKRNLEKQFHIGDECLEVLPMIGGFEKDGILLYSIPADIGRKLDLSDGVGVIVCAIPAKPSLA